MSKMIIPDDVAEAIFTINNYCSTIANCAVCCLYDNSRELNNRCMNTLPDDHEILKETMEVYVYERNE